MGFRTVYGNIMVKKTFKDKAWVSGHERMLYTPFLKFNAADLVLYIAPTWLTGLNLFGA